MTGSEIPEVNYDKRNNAAVRKNCPVGADFQMNAGDDRHRNDKKDTDGIPDSADGVPFFIVIEKVFFLLRHRLVFGALFFFFLLTR